MMALIHLPILLALAILTVPLPAAELIGSRPNIFHNAPARFAVYDWHRNQRPLQEDGYATDLFAAEAERVIATQEKDRPFFLYVPFNAVHGPLDPPPAFDGDRDDPLAVRDGMLKSLDTAVGRILGAIDKHSFRDNTLVVFTNDNGPVLEEMSKPYRGTKNTTFEGGVRVPCLLRWPGHTTAGSRNNAIMFIADWLKKHIDSIRASQPKKWAPGTTPWPLAPKGAHAAKR